MTADRDLVDRVRQYCRLQDIAPDDDDARVPVVAGAVGGDPDRVRAVLNDLAGGREGDDVDDDDDARDDHADAPEGDSRDAPPTPESDNPTSTSTTSDTAEIESYPTESETDADCGVTPRAPPAEEARAAFADVIEWYHRQLDTEIPVDYADTARDYYETVRGWDPDTVDEKRLGYAPGDSKDKLIAYLHDQGHDREAIQASGLFYEDDLYPHFNGRFVLPYADADGSPVYAISRSLDEDNGGHPADHHGDQKYTKAIKGKDYSKIDEPIYGLSSVDQDTDRLLVAGGIADAITLHEAGYACISPVTTVRFKNKHEPRVLDLVDTYDIDRVYIVNDAERPTVDVRESEGDDGSVDRISDKLTIQGWGEGLRGAFGNVEFLAKADVDVDTYLVDLPGGDDNLRKLDPDDYLKEGWGSVETLLASAKPADEHPDYAKWKDSRRSRAVAKARQNDPVKASTDGDASALYDLGFCEVSGLSGGFRGTNPLGHHGESEDYFVVIDDRHTKLGYDHKYGVAYNALTYLACEAGERRASDPQGSFTPEEILGTWVHAKDIGAIDVDDPIPRRALRTVASDATEWDGDLVEHETRDGDTFDGLPADVYNAALDAVREEYGVDPGREPVGSGYDPDADPVAALPFAALDALSPEERKRAVRKRGVEWPDTDEARDELRDAVFRELRAGNTTVLDAPTALGKTYTAATEPWRRRAGVTGESPVVHLHATTDARDEAAAETRETLGDDAGAVLKGRKEASPVARGDHDPRNAADDPETQVVTIDGRPASEWFDHQCDDKRLPFSTALALARDRNDQGLDDLPPQGQEDPAVAQWDGLPRDDDGHPTKDVIHATHPFAYVPSLRAHTNVILDEQPDFTVDLDQDRIRRMVNAYLREIGAPVSTWEALVSLAGVDPTGVDTDAGREYDAVEHALGTDPATEWYVENPDAHALAPDLTRAIWKALSREEPDANGRRSTKVFHEPPRFDAGDGDGYAGVWLSVVVDEENTVRSVRSTPDFSQARAVVGLDAHPSMPRWRLNVAPGMTRDAVLDPTERRLWRRYERGLTVVQVGDATRPRSGRRTAREWMNNQRVRTVLDRLRDHYGDGFDTAITSAQVEPAVRRLLADAVDVDHDDLGDEQSLHFGQEKSRNPEAFADADAGYVYGCMDPGDEMILDALAELGLDATPATVETESGEEKREKGRTFDGPDADTAREVLASVRENHVAQAAGRYARSPDDPDNGATVYVHTNAAPAGFVDVETPGVEWLATDLQREIIETLDARPTATTRDIADVVDCSKEHVRQTLTRLEDEDLVARFDGAGDHGADVYRTDTGTAGDAVADAFADLGLDVVGETTNDRLQDSSRWSLAISPGGRPDDVPTRGVSTTVDADRATSGGDPPPNPGD